MLKCLCNLLFIGFISNFQSQTNDFIHTSGKYMLGSCGDTLLIRGINYAPYNWGYSINDLKLDQIALSGSNTVRLVWYHNNSDQSTLYENTVALDSAISKSIQHKMMVILELHDFTCQNNPSLLAQSSSFWTDPDVLTILMKYKQSIIVNIANEALYVNWSGNATTALNTYRTTYESLITSLRNTPGFDFPIMIDAPDCGQTSDVFITSNTAQNLIDFDPIHNLIFSAHAYWYGYANNDSLQMASKINNMVAANIPFVLGEIANLQDDASMCQYDLNYQALLNHCQTQQVNWLAWTWDHDVCSERQLSSSGSFSSLTNYGNDIIYNPSYGLSNGVVKNKFLEFGPCEETTSLNEIKLSSILIFPTITNGKVKVSNLQHPNSSYRILDFKGCLLTEKNLTQEAEIDLSHFELGIYFISIEGITQKIIRI